MPHVYIILYYNEIRKTHAHNHLLIVVLSWKGCG